MNLQSFMKKAEEFGGAIIEQNLEKEPGGKFLLNKIARLENQVSELKYQVGHLQKQVKRLRVFAPIVLSVSVVAYIIICKVFVEWINNP